MFIEEGEQGDQHARQAVCQRQLREPPNQHTPVGTSAEPLTRRRHRLRAFPHRRNQHQERGCRHRTAEHNRRSVCIAQSTRCAQSEKQDADRHDDRPGYPEQNNPSTNAIRGQDRQDQAGDRNRERDLQNHNGEAPHCSRTPPCANDTQRRCDRGDCPPPVEVGGCCECRVRHLSNIGLRERVLKPPIGRVGRRDKARQRHLPQPFFGRIPLAVESSCCLETRAASVLTL